MNSFQTALRKGIAYCKRHKVISGAIGLAAILLIFFVYRSFTNTSTQTRYVLGTVERGTLITSVTGTGQMSSTDQLDIKPKVSGDIVSINVKAGEQVKAGDIIVKLDSTDAAKTLRDANVNLTAARIAYEKALQQSQNDVTTGGQSVDTSKESLVKAYDDAFNAVADSFVDLPTIVSDTSNILYNSTHSPYLSNQNLQSLGGDTALGYKYAAGREFDQARNLYQTNLADYKGTARTDSADKIESLLNETYTTVKVLSEAEKDLNNVISYVKSQSQSSTTEMTADQNLINSYLTKTNGYVASLYSAKTAITNAKNDVQNAQRTLSQKNTTLNGADTLDVQSAKLTLTQRQNAVADAIEQLSYYTVRAPFDGVVGKVNAKIADAASSGTSVATLSTPNQIATLSLNEIDVAKVAIGQKATMTFDALPDLTITGTVSQVDQIGTVSQGVVSYSVQIALDAPDSTIKPGMSVSASIITEAKPGVLIVPTSAIKTNGNGATVQVVSGETSANAASSSSQGVVLNSTPQTVNVEIGSSNDTETEIVSGLNEGDTVVVRTITGAKTTTTSSTNRSLFGGGAATRIGR